MPSGFTADDEQWFLKLQHVLPPTWSRLHVIHFIGEAFSEESSPVVIIGSVFIFPLLETFIACFGCDAYGVPRNVARRWSQAPMYHPGISIHTKKPKYCDLVGLFMVDDVPQHIFLWLLFNFLRT